MSALEHIKRYNLTLLCRKLNSQPFEREKSEKAPTRDKNQLYKCKLLHTDQHTDKLLKFNNLQPFHVFCLLVNESEYFISNYLCESPIVTILPITVKQNVMEIGFLT